MENKLNLNEKVQKDFLNYATAVIKSRAIPAVEDNLKPVHRRILFTMAENKMWSNKPTMKSTNVIGPTMLIHPHGDSSIYDALIRLAQPWKMRYPLIDVQGNIGNITGDGPAAHRYTECRLSKVGELMLKDINRGAVPFKSSYDERLKEPIILPSAFPNILCNGNTGIAVGLSSSLVPHNFGEVSAAIIAYLNNRTITTEKLMEYILGPDFPTGGVIVDGEKLLDVYKTGQGTVTLRARYNIENVGQKQHIVITEIPFLVNIEDGVKEQLKKLVIEDNFDLIEDFEDNTNNQNINLRIILKKGANVYKVLDTLWKNTRLQITQRIHNMVIIGNGPAVLNLKEMIEHFVRHRHNVIVNTTKFDLEKVEHKIHVLNGILSALVKIDEVIAIIRAANDSTDAKNKLIKMLNIDEVQALAILDIKLSRLSKLDSLELNNDLKSYTVEKEKCLKILGESRERDNIIKMELLELSVKMKDPRRTTILSSNPLAGQELSSEPISLLVFNNGSIIPTQKKIKDLGFGKKGSVLQSGVLARIVDCKTDDIITFLDTEGKIYHTPTLTMNLESQEQLDTNSPISAFDLKKTNKENIIFLTSEGYIKKTSVSDYINSKNGTSSIKLKENDKLIMAELANDTDWVLVLGQSGRLAKFKVSAITKSSRLTIGSKAMMEKPLMGIIAAENDKIFSINNSGQGKVTLCSDYNETSKGGTGQVIAENTINILNDNKGYIIINNGKNIFVDTSNFITKSKIASGAKVASGEIFRSSN